MNSLSFDQILRAAKQLTPQEKDNLIAHLRAGEEDSPSEHGMLLREKLMAEFDRRKAAGAFDQLESLKGKFARAGTHPNAEDVESYLQSLNTAWEEDIDDLAS
jgi:hypothetical protein